MKIISLFLILLIILIPISIAPSHPELIDNELTVTDFINQQYEKFKDKKLDVEKYKVVLPVSLKLVITDTNEIIFFKLDKNGILTLPDSLRKVDFEIITKEDIFFEVIETGKDEVVINYIKEGKIEIIAHSFKAQIASQVLEDKLGVTITKKKTFRQKTIAFLAAKITNLFVKKNA